MLSNGWTSVASNDHYTFAAQDGSDSDIGHDSIVFSPNSFSTGFPTLTNHGSWSTLTALPNEGKKGHIQLQLTSRYLIASYTLLDTSQEGYRVYRARLDSQNLARRRLAEG